MKSIKTRLLSAVALLSIASVQAAKAADVPAWANDAACQTLTMAAAGGPTPKNPDLMVLRYAGSANFEVAVGNTVLLFDAQYARSAPARSIGVTPEQLNKATALYIGHGHADHMSEGPQIAMQSKAPLYGAAITTDTAIKMGLPAAQAKTVKNGDVQKYPGFTVESILAQHNSRTPEFVKVAGGAWRGLQEATGIARPAGAPQSDRIEGSRDPKVLTEGTYAFLITFDNGYKFMMVDSSGPITEGERAVMKRIGKVDAASIAYQGYYVPARQIEGTLPLVELFKPDVFIPNHHDETAGSFPDLGTEPLFVAIREKMPHVRSISPLLRTPICVNTKTKEVFVGETWTFPKS